MKIASLIQQRSQGLLDVTFPEDCGTEALIDELFLTRRQLRQKNDEVKDILRKFQEERRITDTNTQHANVREAELEQGVQAEAKLRRQHEEREKELYERMRSEQDLRERDRAAAQGAETVLMEQLKLEKMKSACDVHVAHEEQSKLKEEIDGQRHNITTADVAAIKREKKLCQEYTFQIEELQKKLLEAEKKEKNTTTQMQQLEDRLKELQTMGLKLGRYAIDSAKPGYLLLVSNIKFHTSRDRPGTEKDVNSVLTAFGAVLQYRCTQETNCTAQDISARLTSVAKNPDLSDYSCLAVVLLSHGGADGVMGVDGDFVAEKDIIKILGASAVWAEKPKLVVIQACRGDERLGGVATDVSDAADMTSEGAVADDAQDDGPLPVGIDMIVAQAIPAGYLALRNPKTGSYFIQSFTQHVKEFGRTYDVDTIMKKVTDDVVQTRDGRGKLCVPSISHNSLRKLFYLA